MRLSQLIQGMEPAPRHGGGGAGVDPEITSVVSDSRAVRPGCLFVCVVGGTADGHDFAAQAVERGAAAVLAERPVPVPVQAGDAPLLLVDSTRAALGPLALRLAGHPEAGLEVAGITGTNGKTTVAFLLAAILREAGRRVGLIGTVGTWAAGERLDDGGLTTPDAIALADTFTQLAGAGCDAAVMEVSSHALEQGRVGGLRFQAAAFTNLSRDHLDYHGDMESYFLAKARLFHELLAEGGRGVVNVDDPHGRRLLPLLHEPLRVSLEDEAAEIHAISQSMGLDGIELRVSTPLGEAAIRSPLIGAFNAENLLVATGLAVSLGVSLPEIEAGLASSHGAPGRMERVGEGDVAVFIDYAHTDDALRRALAALREAGPQRLIVVFGCGGDRDRGKRPLMGEAAAAADVVVVTSDNPRTEDPAQIIEAILPGLGGHRALVVEPDRRAAIDRAIAMARPGDAVLIAGKGHEDYQIVGKTRLPFDDREEARRALGARGMS